MKREKVSLIGEITMGILNIAGAKAKTFQAEHECQVHHDERACKLIQRYDNQAQDATTQIGKQFVELLK